MGNVFNASNLLESNFTKPTYVEKINVEESYFCTALAYLNEMDQEINAATGTLYKSILEAGDSPVAINESFSSFCGTIKKIIERFLGFLKSIVQKFILAMNKLVKSDKYIDKHKGDLKNFNPEDEFDVNMFIFTYLADDKVPSLDPLESWDDSKGFDSSDPKGTLLAKTTQMYNSQKEKMNGGWYDTFRAQVINYPNGMASITADDFADELFKLFRNNSKDKTEETISYDKALDTLNRFEAYEDNLKHVQDNKKKLESGYLKIKKDIESWSTAGTDGKGSLNVIYGDHGTVAANSAEYKEHKAEIDEQADLFIKSKVNQIDHMCKIHAMVFTAKLDAIKSSYAQDKAILYKALTKAQKSK
jgi:hypothetical protein